MREDGKKKLEEDRKRVRREKILLDKAQTEMDVQKGKNVIYIVTFKIDSTDNRHRNNMPRLEIRANTKTIFILYISLKHISYKY